MNAAVPSSSPSPVDASSPAQASPNALPPEVVKREVNVLVADADDATFQRLNHALRGSVRRIERSRDVGETYDRIKSAPYHVIVADVSGQAAGERPSRRHLELCRYLAENRPDTSVVVLANEGNTDAAVASMRAGAFDLVTAPIEEAQVQSVVSRAASHALLERKLHRLEDTSAEVDARDLIGESQAMKTVLDQISRVADTDVTVLITGESGTGKELVARALHRSSHRAQADFVAVNCAAIPSDLLEAELFGHVRGAFTDAKKSKDGLFVRAQGGTLFLDEVGEMPADMQVKLLRALQERKVRPVGGTSEIDVDVRLLAATNRDLEARVMGGSFREDLFYRLNVVRIQTPPLRTRGNDVLMLAEHFMHRWAERMNKGVTSISGEAAQLLLTHTWPGNVRELENVIQRAVALSRYDEIVPADLGALHDAPVAPRMRASMETPGRDAPRVVAPPRPTAPVATNHATTTAPPTTPAGTAAIPTTTVPTADAPSLLDEFRKWAHTHLATADLDAADAVPSLVDIEETYIQAVLDACEGNKTRAAERLGMARRTLYRRLDRITASAATVGSEREDEGSDGPVDARAVTTLDRAPALGPDVI